VKCFGLEIFSGFVSFNDKSKSGKLTTPVANQFIGQYIGEDLLQSQSLKSGESSSCKKQGHLINIRPD